ncbi:MAG: CotH kinase family protein [Verrucomicrobiae bacterium]|nr:CotH kinase family protein [Verrucomicrobiae bacterium]
MALVVLMLGTAQSATLAGPGLRWEVGEQKFRVGMADDARTEWRFQRSEDLVRWVDVPSMGTVRTGSGEVAWTAPIVVNPGAGAGFLRGVATEGLYDAAVLRTFHLRFAQADWRSRLTANYATAINLAADLEFEGVQYAGVGVRYKGNTSYFLSGAKKSLNIEIDYSDPDRALEGYRTLNLNNAFSDSTLMREPLYFNALRQYAVGPRAGFAQLYINDEYWGVYVLAQQTDGELIREYFASNRGDRWKAPSGGGGGGGGGGPGGGGGGGFASGQRALMYLGDDPARYQALYELKKDGTSNAWANLIHAADVLNNAPAEAFRDRVEEVLAVDRWLWFLAVENVYTDDDSYWNKGADYGIYFEPESGRLHPLQHDGNEAFGTARAQLNPLQGVGNANRPVISRLLAIPELRQRYLAHLRTVLDESFRVETVVPLMDRQRALIEDALEGDTRRGFTMAAFRTALTALTNHVRLRHAYLANHVEIRPIPPSIVSVMGPSLADSSRAARIVATIRPYGGEGIDSVWLHRREGDTGPFTPVAMVAGGPGSSGESGGETLDFEVELPPAPVSTRIRYYVEARSGNAAHAASFAPARAEQETFEITFAPPVAGGSPVLINELMASNGTTLADPQGHFDDWIELWNRTDAPVDLSGWFLSDNPERPRKWRIPDGTTLAPGGFLLVWADEDGGDQPGLHANFKLSADGEQILLVDRDDRGNAVMDFVAFGPQRRDVAYGRSAREAGRWEFMRPTPGQPNR